MPYLCLIAEVDGILILFEVKPENKKWSNV